VCKRQVSVRLSIKREMAKNKSVKSTTGKATAKTSTASSASGSEKTGFHVLRSPGGGWYVKVDGRAAAVDRFSTKREAVSYARSLTKGSFATKTQQAPSGNTDVFVHDGAGYNTKSFKSGKVSRPELPRASRPTHRVFGSAKGRIKVSNDFDETPFDFDDYIQ
jgi:hypothetical protein